jgi:UDPglucose 6-dehydrogenase
LNLTMFGTGYVGLVTGACFAEMGNRVVCVDVDREKIEALNDGSVPIFEPGLETIVQSNLAAGRLQITTDSKAGVDHGDVIFIAVGTPADEDGSADLQYVLAVAETIATHMASPKIVVDKSTVPVGTGDRVRDTIAAALRRRGRDLAFSVVSNPEFLKEGAAINDFMKPDRIIIGTDDEHSARVLTQLYRPFNRNHDRLLLMDLRSAELTKYAANVMLATRISLMNELANLADRLGADIEAVRRGIGSDPRIGFSFIYPGGGYGGSCFPKDGRALIHTAQHAGVDPEVMRGVAQVNERQKTVLLQKIRHHFEGRLEGLTFALWGLAFKPNTDDMREAPSLVLMQQLWESGARVRAYDPAASEEARRLFGNREDFTLCATRDETLDGADALVVVTEWNEFRSPDFQRVKAALRNPVVFDGRNLYEPEYLGQLGFSYYGIGRGLLARGLDGE